MIKTDSYDPIIIRMKRFKSDLFIFNRFQYPILDARIPIDTDYFYFNRLFSAGNVMRENGFFSQHRHFLYDKFLFNGKSLQIHKH